MHRSRSNHSASWAATPTIEEAQQRLALTYRETAALLGVSERTVWGLVKKKEIPHFKIGSRVLILRSDLERWAEAKARTTIEKGAA